MSDTGGDEAHLDKLHIIGHAWAAQQLERSIARGTLAQSHLFVGPESIGKATLAREMAAALLTQHSRDAARARTLAKNNKHPDLTWVELLDDKSQISVEQIRDLIHTLSLAPIEGRHRVAVVDGAHAMNANAQNALLKTLEEPNPAVVLVLIAPNVDGLLPTIVSRCQVLSLRAIAHDEIARAMEARGVEGARARELAHFARGRVGWAIRAAAEPELLDARKKWVNDLREVMAANRTARFGFAESMAREDATHVQAVLEEWMAALRANVHADANAAASLRELLTTSRRLSQNANTRLVLDALMLRLPVAH